MIRRYLGFVAVVSLLTAGCGGTDSTIAPTAPSTAFSGASAPTLTSSTPTTTSAASSACTVTVLDLPETAAASRSQTSFSVVSGPGCAWTARSDSLWADVTPGSGQGNGTAALTVDANPGTNARTATVTIGGQAYRIVQDALACTYTLNRSTVQLGSSAGGASVTLTTAPFNCPWTASVAESWVTLRPSDGVGDATLQIEVSANASGTRSATVTVGSARLTVTQAAR